MNKVKKEPQWSAFLRFYTEQNKGRLIGAYRNRDRSGQRR